MRKITKWFLAAVLFVAGAGAANAEKVYADLTQYTSNWDGADVSFSWTATYGNQLLPALDLPTGDLRSWEKLVVVVDELTNCDFFRVLVYNGDDTNHSNTFKATSTGNNEFTLSGNVDNLNNVTKIVLSGSNWEDSQQGTWSETPASFKVKEVYLERPDIVYIEASTVFEAPYGTTDLKNLTGTETNWASTVTYPKELAVQGASFGNGDGSNESTHVDIDGYDYLCFEVTTATESTAGLRTWIWDGTKVVTLYAKPIADYATADYTEASKITGVGTYVVKISGYQYLKGVKAANDWGSPAAVVSMAWVSKGEAPVAYQPTGKYTLIGEEPGSATLTDALNDANATFYDASGVTATGIELVPANPNALFSAADGVLTNGSNVLVSGVCAHLSLTDGMPFKAPEAFTATTATFSKEVTAANYATMVLPFDAALPAGVEAYNITGATGNVLSTTAASAIAANKPVLLKNAGTYTFSASEAAVAATGTTAQNGLLNGVYALTDVPTANGYVLQNQSGDVSFFKAADGQTALPFRAYLTTMSAPARLLLDINDTATGIVEIGQTDAVANTVYNLSGHRVAQPVKGLYIVAGKKVMIK